MPNPYQDVDSAKDFSKKLGIKLDAPANSTNKAYHIISSAIADVDFDLNGHSYSLRASKSNEDFSGVEGDVIRTEGINFVDGAHLDVIQSGEEQYLRITWTVDGITYYLSNFDGATISDITSVLGTVTYGK